MKKCNYSTPIISLEELIELWKNSPEYYLNHKEIKAMELILKIVKLNEKIKGQINDSKRIN